VTSHWIVQLGYARQRLLIALGADFAFFCSFNAARMSAFFALLSSFVAAGTGSHFAISGENTAYKCEGHGEHGEDLGQFHGVIQFSF
jgi:hypothetical protein